APAATTPSSPPGREEESMPSAVWPGEKSRGASGEVGSEPPPNAPEDIVRLPTKSSAVRARTCMPTSVRGALVHTAHAGRAGRAAGRPPHGRPCADAPRD